MADLEKVNRPLETINTDSGHNLDAAATLSNKAKEAIHQIEQEVANIGDNATDQDTAADVIQATSGEVRRDYLVRLADWYWNDWWYTRPETPFGEGNWISNRLVKYLAVPALVVWQRRNIGRVAGGGYRYAARGVSWAASGAYNATAGGAGWIGGLFAGLYSGISGMFNRVPNGLPPVINNTPSGTPPTLNTTPGGTPPTLNTPTGTPPPIGGSNPTTTI